MFVFVRSLFLLLLMCRIYSFLFCHSEIGWLWDITDIDCDVAVGFKRYKSDVK